MLFDLVATLKARRSGLEEHAPACERARSETPWLITTTSSSAAVLQTVCWLTGSPKIRGCTSAAGSRPPRRFDADRHPGGFHEAPQQPTLKLAVCHRAGTAPVRPHDTSAARRDPWRIEFDQRHGLRARQSLTRRRCV